LLENATASKRMQNLKDFLNWVCFNLLIGNNDSHSKNISFLLKGQRIELAPFYDLLCTSIYTSLKKDFSFYIGGRNRFEQIGLNQFHQEEENLGIKKNSFVQRMKDVRARVLEHKDRVTTEVLSQYPKAKIAKRISQLISKRAKGLTQQGITGD
ncbi:MAG: HipA domain-containing protein, partial [Pseudobdellovibrionaceae bacterium]